MIVEGVLTGKCLVCMQLYPGLDQAIKSHMYGDGLHRNVSAWRGHGRVPLLQHVS